MWGPGLWHKHRTSEPLGGHAGQSTPQLRGPPVTTILPLPQDLRIQSPFSASVFNRISETLAGMWGSSPQNGGFDASQQLIPSINPAWGAPNAHEQTHVAATGTATRKHSRSNHTTTTHIATAPQAERGRLLRGLPASVSPPHPSHPAGSMPCYLVRTES